MDFVFIARSCQFQAKNLFENLNLGNTAFREKSMYVYLVETKGALFLAFVIPPGQHLYCRSRGVPIAWP